jgi:hypothetical protein
LRLAEPRRPTSRHGLSPESPLLGHGPAPEGYDHQTGVLDLPAPAPEDDRVDLRDLRGLVPAAEPGREVDDWGRSQRIFDLVEPLLDFYYRHWFRVEVEGIENVPEHGGALIVSNHSGALPPDAPMIMQAIRHEHRRPRPLYMLGENWFKGYPGVGMLANKIGLVGAHPANAQRLLRDEQRLVLVFPEGQKGSPSSTGSATGCAASAAAGSCAPRCAPACPSSPPPWWARRRRCRSSPTCLSSSGSPG